MKPLLFLIQPRLGPAGARTTIRLSTGGSGAAGALGGFNWESAVTRRPRLAIELLSPDLDGRVQFGRGDFAIGANAVRQADARTLYWPGAPITIYDATNLDLVTAPIEFAGYVKSGQIDLDSDTIVLNLEVNVQALDKPVLNAEFSGGGGLLGDPGFKGVLKPAGFGSVKNIEPVWFDAARNIGMVDGYGNTGSIDALFEGASAFGPRVANYADYATLAARIDDKTVPPGRWATCVAQGLVGLGAPPVAPITVDAVFGSNRPGALMRRLIETHAAVPVGEVDTAAFTALDVAVNRAVHYWTGTQRDVQDLVEAIAGSCNATPIVTFQGKYSVTRAFGGANAATINRQAPTAANRVTKWRSIEAEPPTWRMKMVAERPGTVLNIDQVLYADDIIDRGVFEAGTVYRQGNLVWNDAGAQFLYVNTTPAAGAALPVPPATTTASWEQTKPAPDAADLFYTDGTPIEYLKPAEPNATATVNRGAWAGATAYAKGDIVQYLGTSWFTNTAHTSNASFPPGHASNTQMTALVTTVTGFLTNESATVSTAVDGTGGSYAGAGGTYKMFLGTKDITTGNGVTYSIVSQTSGLGLTLDTSTGVYAITGPTVDTATATLRATFGGVPYDKIYSFAKSKAGSSITGPGGPVIALTSDAQAFKYVDNVASPASQTITLKAIRQNTGETVNWSTSPAVTLGTTADSLERTLTIANFAANRQVVVTATGATTGVKDTMTLVRLDQSTAEALATRNEDGANMIRSPLLFDLAEFGNGAFLSFDPAGTGRPITRRRAILVNTQDSYVFFEGDTMAMPVFAGERLYASYVAQGSGVTTDTVVGIIQWHNALGVLVSQTTMNESRISGTLSNGLPTLGRGSALVPASGVSSARFYVVRETIAQAGNFLVAEGYLGRAQQGADVTTIIEGPAQSTVFNYDYLGAAAAGQFNRDLTFKLNSAAGQITTGIVWTWKVLTGTVNGLTSASGVQAMTGAGTGTMTVSSLGADVSKVEVTATYLGAVRVKQFELTRNIASAPVGGGGGGGSTTLKTKTSGWSSFNTTTFVAISGSDFNGCTLPAGKTQFDVSASLSVEPDTGAVNGSWTVEVKWQRLIASVWTDIGSPAVASGSSSVTGLGGAEPEPVVNPASITCNKSETGLTAASTHDLRLVARTTAAKLHYVNGSAAVVAP